MNIESIVVLILVAVWIVAAGIAVKKGKGSCNGNCMECSIKKCNKKDDR